MILVVGGMAQGKRAFAEEHLEAARYMPEGSVSWSDGETASFKDFSQAPLAFHLEAFIGRLLKGDPSLARTGGILPDPWGDAFADALVDVLLTARRERILVCNEIGCGIVPIEAYARRWREQTGRVCCLLAAGADEVWQVSCGLGRRIK